MKDITFTLGRLLTLRNKADYDLAPSGLFRSDGKMQRALDEATDALQLLDRNEGDAALRAAAIAALRAAGP